jgi:hypothetical protein
MMDIQQRTLVSKATYPLVDKAEAAGLVEREASPPTATARGLVYATLTQRGPEPVVRQLEFNTHQRVFTKPLKEGESN